MHVDWWFHHLWWGSNPMHPKHFNFHSHGNPTMQGSKVRIWNSLEFSQWTLEHHYSTSSDQSECWTGWNFEGEVKDKINIVEKNKRKWNPDIKNSRKVAWMTPKCLKYVFHEMIANFINMVHIFSNWYAITGTFYWCILSTLCAWIKKGVRLPCCISTIS